MSLLSIDSATYRTYRHSEPYCVEYSGGDGTVMEWILDALVITEKTSLIRLFCDQL